jgi:hypothetical protein
MRTSVTLDEDVYQLASIYASSRGITLGAALGELVRKAGAAETMSSQLKTAPNGLRIFPSRGRAITPEMVKEAQEDTVA